MLMLKGSHHSIESKEKIRSIRLGSYHSDTTRKKISSLMKGRKITWGEKISVAQIGKVISQETIEKNRLAHLGKKHSKATRKKMSLAQQGKSLSPEHREKLRQVALADGRRPDSKRGVEHYNWKGGITPENMKVRNSLQYRTFRKAVMCRDNWTCQNCFLKGGWNKELKERIKLEVHHKKAFSKYPELRFSVENGKTLCKGCHLEVERTIPRLS